MCISRERIYEIVSELQQWKLKTTTMKRKLLSLLSKLSFISRVVRCGLMFKRRLIELAKRARYLHYRIRLNRSAQSDIQWWLSYLPMWNGVNYFYDQDWTSSNHVNFTTDAIDFDIGGIYGRHWFSVDYHENLSG